MTSEPGTTNRRLPRITIAPAEGWLTLGLVLLMCLCLAWAMDDARWVPGRPGDTDLLALAVVGGVLVGFIGAKVRWRRSVVIVVGVLFAALILPILAGLTAVDGGASPGVLFRATADEVVRAWRDLAILQLSLTNATGHFVLAMLILCWATGQFAAYAVFGHHRPFGAIVVVGILLVANMAATFEDQLEYLVIFSLAALFLLIRTHAFEEHATWLRRRLGDPAAVSSLYLRSGTVFIGLAVVAAITLTATASSNPLAGAWAGLKPWLIEMGQEIQRYLPAGIESRPLGQVVFGPNAAIGPLWNTSSDLALTIQLPPGEKELFYWRATTYDTLDLAGPRSSERTEIPREAQADLLADTGEVLPATGRRQVAFQVSPDYLEAILSPQTPISVDRPTRLLTVAGGFYAGLVQPDGHNTYSVIAQVPTFGEAEGQLTGNKLRITGTETAYPDAIRARYLQPLPAGLLGESSDQVLADILATSKPTNPYDLAKAIEAYLRDGANFNYDTDVRDIDCGSLSAIECFAQERRGFCLHYASLMVALLREQRVPARVAQGFLPGERDQRTGVEIVRNSQAHAWVEVYFPGYGWVNFDPTGGNVAQLAPIPAGSPVASGPPPSPLSTILPDDDEGPSRAPTSAGGTTPTRGGDGGPFILITGLLLVTLGGIVFILWRRGPRDTTTADGAFAGVGRIAGRFGFGPRPTQTAYEYAAALGEVLPSVRPELHTVATAKVEVAYGRRVLDSEGARALRDAYRKVRVALLSLVLRRKERFRR